MADDESYKQRKAGARSVIQWLMIVEQYRKLPTSAVQLYADFEHSSLVERLLRGQEPLDTPPPVSFSYPNYGLIEDGYDRALEVWEANDDLGKGLAKTYGCDAVLVIDQAPWKIVEKKSDSEYLVQYLIRRPDDSFEWSETVFKATPSEDSFGGKAIWRIERV